MKKALNSRIESSCCSVEKNSEQLLLMLNSYSCGGLEVVVVTLF
jgi:hypothetical protein